MVAVRRAEPPRKRAGRALPEDGLDDSSVEADEFEVAFWERIEVDGGAEFQGAAGGSAGKLANNFRRRDHVGVAGAALAGDAAGGVDVEEGVWGNLGKNCADVGGEGFDGIARRRGAVLGVELEAGGADWREVDGGGGEMVRQGQSVAPDAAAQVEYPRAGSRAEILVAGDT